MRPQIASVLIATGSVVFAIALTFYAWYSTSVKARSIISILRPDRSDYTAVNSHEDADEFEDGNEATFRSAALRSRGATLGRTPRILTVLAAAITLVASIFSLSVAIHDRAQLTEAWLFVLGWLLVTTQGTLLIWEKSIQMRFNLGICIAFSSVFLVLGQLFEVYAVAVIHSVGQQHLGLGIGDVLRLVQIITGTLTVLSSVSLPRQFPSYHGGKIEDAQLAISAFDRYTFSWARPLLDQARVQKGLEYSDLPALDRYTRSANLRSRFDDLPKTPKEKLLWRRLFRDHQSTFIKQWSLTTVESLVMMCPAICLYKILSLLEERNKLDKGNAEMWFWVFGLGLSKTVHLGLESWIEWINFAILATPIRSQLSALIFQKSMHMRDIQHVKKNTKNTLRDNDKLSIDEGKSDDMEMETLLAENSMERGGGGGAEEDDQADEPSEASRGAINLLGIDVQRVSDFCGYNNLLLGSLVKITLAGVLLVSLIGWWSTLAGLSVPLIFQPLNQIATKYYSQATQELMSARDKKTHLITEALHGIRQIKFSAIEEHWQQVIIAARANELRCQWRVSLWSVFLVFCWLSMPILLGAAALGTYSWINGSMTASVAFTALAVFSSLEWTLSVVPTTITELLDAKTSIARIQEHLDHADKPEDMAAGDSLTFRNASIRWPSDEDQTVTFTLQNLDLNFPEKQLSVIHGKTGSGKSLLLLGIIGEADIISGKISFPRPAPGEVREDHLATDTNWVIPSAVAFVSQIPWIENASLKNNILFGLPFNETRYKKVLQACALVKDLEMLPDGEETEIGASGINLSGGQRWRVTFARAIYSRAGFLILDDIFSAVDAHVGRHILEKALVGELGVGRTRILVTHHIDLVRPYASHIIELGDEGYVKSVDYQNPSKVHLKPSLIETVDDDIVEALNEVPLDETANKPGPRKFVEEELREQGRVKWSVYATYIRAIGGSLYAIMTIGIFVLSAVAMLWRSYWIKLWTQNYEQDTPLPPSGKIPRAELPSDAPHGAAAHLTFYLSIYLAISIIAALSVAAKSTAVLLAANRASRRLFEDVIHNVLRAPLRWLDTVPVGRILNRFVSDFALVDSRLGGDFVWSAHGVFIVITIVCAAMFVSVYMIVPVLILTGSCLYFVNIYLDGARDMKRLEASAKSPIFELFGSSMIGLATIRSFNKVDEYLDQMYVRIDDHARTTWHLLLVSRWMAFRQGFIGTLFSLCVASAVVLIRSIDASLAGFTLGFALEYSNIAVQTIGRYAGFELDMNSTERIVEYTNLVPESQSGKEVSPSWPSEGRLAIKNLDVSYAPDLPLVLKNLSFTVESRQRVGVVGRTGSGKSSLTLSLFRFLEARAGSIQIDDVDISKIKTHDLRSRLGIIPQDPVLFSGTLRSNIDPFNEHRDSAIIDALGRIHLLDAGKGEDSKPQQPDKTLMPEIQHNLNIFNNLNTPISRGGLNLSQGQRQLICLARAIIKRPKLIVLDEATSAVDMRTDSLIQQSIRKQFSESTLLVVAHRLSTIADFDKILVMSDGQAVEFDTPRALLQKKGAFWELLNESGEKDAIEAAIL